MDAPGIAKALGVGKVWVKDESARLGLPAFKVLGASWAVYKALEERLPGARSGIGRRSRNSRRSWNPCGPSTSWRPPTATTAAPWRVAGLLGLGAGIFVPEEMVDARREAIAEEGRGGRGEGTYDEAVARSYEEAGALSRRLGHVLARLRADPFLGDRGLLDHALGDRRRARKARGDGAGPRGRAGRRRCLRRRRHAPLPRSAAFAPPEASRRRARECGRLLESVAAGRIVSVPGRDDSIMAPASTGGRPSLVPGPPCRGASTASSPWDEPAREAMLVAAASGIVSGETGAAGLGGLLELLRRGESLSGEDQEEKSAGL